MPVDWQKENVLHSPFIWGGMRDRHRKSAFPKAPGPDKRVFLWLKMNKLSQQIELEAQQEESDWMAWRLHEKAYKQAKKEDFEDEILPKIKASPLVSFVTDKIHFYQIGFKDGKVYDYYTGRDRLMQHKPAKWFYGGKNILIGLIMQPEKSISEIEWGPELTIHDPELPGVVIVDSIKS